MKYDEATRFIPIVMVTALKELEDKIKSIEAGADDFLTKPIVKIEMLTRIKSLIRVKRLHDDLGDTQECLDAAQRSADLLHYMIQDLLDISKLEENKLNLIREDVVVEQLATVSMDRTLIYRVISNLLLNAVKHTGRGGTITLKATAEGDKVTISVVDNGHGIPGQYLETIFEKFGQVETRQRTGTALGLTFCKMAVEAHGGRIWVESVEGEGSTFSFSLPISAA